MNIKYLKESRKDYNLTQAKMAEALGRVLQLIGKLN